jgi:hypothetical protein
MEPLNLIDVNHVLMQEKEKPPSEAKVDQNGAAPAPPKEKEGQSLSSASQSKNPEKKKASRKKIISCRRNGRRGGPNTPGGKERSSRNAMKHCLTALRHVVPQFDDPSEYQLFRERLIAGLAPVGVLEERSAQKIIQYWWQQDSADADEAAQRYMALREAILAPYIDGSSYDGPSQREEHIERLEPELAYLDNLLNFWDEETGLTEDARATLKTFSFGQSVVDLEHATPEEQYGRLRAVAEQQRGILGALEGEEVPFLIRARARAAGVHLHRHQCTVDRRLERELRHFYQLQERRREREAKERKRPRKSGPIIDVDSESA